ncbi:MAG: inositol monophosphatase [Patescibacteria group bacterium]|nr:inositol monophosphatase [Patescibacteria group bacterium]
MDKRFKPIIKAAQLGGAKVRKYFGKEFTVTEKSDASDYCTTADLESEKAVINHLKKNFYGYKIYSEEAGLVVKGDGKQGVFYVDPLDGTNNFVLGIPYFSTAIVLVEDDQAQFAVVYDSIGDLTYWAQRGHGAYLGRKKLSVSTETDIERSTIAFVGGYTMPTQIMVNALGKIWRREVKRVITNWSPQMDFCALASGRIEGIVHNNEQLFDFLGGKLIAKEAGAIISKPNGKLEEAETAGEFIVSNKIQIHKQLVKIINR